VRGGMHVHPHLSHAPLPFACKSGCRVGGRRGVPLPLMCPAPLCTTSLLMPPIANCIAHVREGGGKRRRGCMHPTSPACPLLFACKPGYRAGGRGCVPSHSQPSWCTPSNSVPTMCPPALGCVPTCVREGRGERKRGHTTPTSPVCLLPFVCKSGGAQWEGGDVHPFCSCPLCAPSPACISSRPLSPHVHPL